MTCLCLIIFFLAEGPVKFVKMNIRVPLPKPKTGYNIFVKMTDWYPRLSKAIPIRKTTAINEGQIFVENQVLPYSISDQLLTDNGPLFVGWFLNKIWIVLATGILTTTAYFLQRID